MSGILQTLVYGAAAAVTDAYFKLVTLLLPGNGTNGAQNNTFLDSSSNNFTITRNGNTTQGTFTPFSQTGWGNYFNGSSSLYAADNTAFQFGSGDFTIEAWVYASAPVASGTAGAIVAKYISGSSGFSDDAYAMYIYNNSGTMQVLVGLISGTTETNNFFNLPSNDTLLGGVWHHVAVTRSGNSVRVFWDGSQIGSTVTYSSTLNPGTGPLNIGARNANNSTSQYENFFTGYISNLRITKGGALYTSNFTPSTTPLTTTVSAGTVSLLTCQSNRFVDNSSNAFALTVNGSPSIQSFSPFAPTAAYSSSVVGGSGYFDGSGDYLSIANNAAFDFGSGDFTIEFWLNLNVSSDQNIIAKWWTGGNQWVIQYRAAGSDSRASQHIRVAWNSSSIADFDFTIPLFSWNHFAIVKSSGTLYVYLNGVRNATTASIGALTATTDIVSIGQFGNQSTGYVNGYMSGIRITKGGALYTTSTFTVPTAPPTTTVSAGTVSALLNYTNAGITDATAKNDLETVGNAQISTTQSKFGGSSMYFDGTGDYLSNYSDAGKLNSNFRTGDFTIEFWVYHTSLGSNEGYCDSAGSLTTTTAGQWYVYKNSSNKILFGQHQSAALITSTGSVSATTWTHIAVCRSGTTTRLFINGTQDGSTTTAPDFSAAGGIQIGVIATPYYLNGYIDDLRITKYARYTANFTAPTAAFPLQ